MHKAPSAAWAERSLFELGKYVNGYAFKPDDWSEHGLPIVRIAQITGSSTTCDYFSGTLSDVFKLRSGDLVFSWSGTLAVVKWRGGPAWLNQHLFRVDPAPDIDRDYLYHVLSASVAEMDKRTHGSTMKHIKRGELREHRVPVPQSMREQGKIAQILDSLDNQIRQTEALIAKLERIKQGLLTDLLTRGIDQNSRLRPTPDQAPHLYKDSPFGSIPKVWEVKPLSELSEVNRGKFTHRPRNDPEYYGGEYPFIQTGDVAAAKGGIVFEYSQTLSRLGTTASSVFPAGTIAISIAANIADTAILGIPMYFPDSVVGAVVNQALADVRFIELCIRRAKRMLDAKAPQSAQKNINLQDLRPLLIPTPSLAEQKLITERYQALVTKINAEKKLLNKLSSEKCALMDDLLAGRVRVTPLLKAKKRAIA